MLNFLIPAAASLLGGAMANDSRERSAWNQMEFQREMSNTSHQREVQDLIAAGLNPMLSAKLGGASTPPGASYQAENIVAPAVASALQAKLTAAQVDKMEEETSHVKAQTQLVKEQTEIAAIEHQAKMETGLEMAHAQLKKVQGEVGLSAAQIRNLDSQTANNVETLKNIPEERERLIRAAHLLYMQASLYGQQQLTEAQRYELVKAQAAVYVKEGKLLQLDIDAAESWGNAGRITKEVRPYLELLMQIIHGPRRGRGVVGSN